jgi:hypothetical protein
MMVAKVLAEGKRLRLATASQEGVIVRLRLKEAGFPGEITEGATGIQRSLRLLEGIGPLFRFIPVRIISSLRGNQPIC